MNSLTKRKRTRVADKLVSGYLRYQKEVKNRVAHSIGCDPSDIDSEDIVEMFITAVTAKQASIELENRMTDPSHWHVETNNVGNEDVPF